MHDLQHIAIIPDGNRRWAVECGKSALDGHKQGADVALPNLFDALIELNIRYFTFWAMSPDNFSKRNEQEITHLLLLLTFYLEHKIKEIHAKNIQIRIIGDTTVLSKKLQKLLNSAVEMTKQNTRLTVIFAINYSGRNEIIRAVQKVMESGRPAAEFTESTFEQYLDTAGLPDPDMIIRTGGEKRTSGFLSWQSEYTEYIFLDTYFPAFTPQLLKQCVDEYYARQRRFGK